MPVGVGAGNTVLYMAGTNMARKSLLSHFWKGAALGVAVASIISPLWELLACRIFHHGFDWKIVAGSILFTAIVDGIWMVCHYAAKNTGDRRNG